MKTVITSLALLITCSAYADNRYARVRTTPEMERKQQEQQAAKQEQDMLASRKMQLTIISTRRKLSLLFEARKSAATTKLLPDYDEIIQVEQQLLQLHHQARTYKFYELDVLFNKPLLDDGMYAPPAQYTHLIVQWFKTWQAATDKTWRPGIINDKNAAGLMLALSAEMFERRFGSKATDKLCEDLRFDLRNFEFLK